MELIDTDSKFGLRKGLILAAMLLLAAVGGYMDFTVDKVLREDISFNLFFLIPVGIAVWFIGIKSGILVSAFSSAACFMADVIFDGFKTVHYLPPIWNSATGFIFFICLAYLLYAVRRELKMHKQLSMEDFLTKASNSRAFYNYAKIEIARIQRYKKPLTIVYLDVDNFKQVNDTYGHAAGDELLVTFVNAVHRNIRATDAVGRLGGDEFAILLPEMDAYAAPVFIEHMRKAVETEMRSKGFKAITYSAGVLTCTKTPESVQTMLKIADDAMYEVKKHGKNGVKYITCD